jgi:hypothetical protein
MSGSLKSVQEIICQICETTEHSFNDCLCYFSRNVSMNKTMLETVFNGQTLRHRPKTFTRAYDSILLFFSSNLNNRREVWICSASQTLFGVQPLSRVLETKWAHSFILLESWDKYLQLSYRPSFQIMMLSIMFYLATKSIISHSIS